MDELTDKAREFLVKREFNPNDWKISLLADFHRSLGEWTAVSEGLPERKEGCDYTEQYLLKYLGSEFQIEKYGIGYYHYNSPYEGSGWIDFPNLGRTPVAYKSIAPYQPQGEGKDEK